MRGFPFPELRDLYINGFCFKERLLHHNEMTRYSSLDFRRKRSGAGFDKPEAAVITWELFPDINDPQFNCMEAFVPGKFLGRMNKRRAQTRSLSVWRDRKQPEIHAVAIWFEVDAANDAGFVLCQKDCSSVEQFVDSINVDTVGVQKKALYFERCVYQIGDCLGVFGARHAHI